MEHTHLFMVASSCSLGGVGGAQLVPIILILIYVLMAITAHASNQNNRKKFEIATDEVGNPIKQDEKKGKLREFKKGDIFFNYGCLPVSYCILLFLQHMLCLIGS